VSPWGVRSKDAGVAGSPVGVVMVDLGALGPELGGRKGRSPNTTIN